MKRFLLVASALTLLLAGCGGSHKIRKGVAEIDIHSPAVSRTVTDASQVTRIVRWFHALKLRGKTSWICAGGEALNVTFTFRSANGAKLASAHSAPATANPCNPILLSAHRQQPTFFIDSKQGTPLIDRVQHLLGVRFGPTGYRG